METLMLKILSVEAVERWHSNTRTFLLTLYKSMR